MRRPLALDASSLILLDHEFVLHAERALEVPASRTLIVADLHWGKATALRAHGVPVPTGGTRDDLKRLDAALTRSRAEQLLILGDLAHSRHGWDTRALEPVQAWRSRWPDLAITLVRGNHDRHAGDPPPALDIACVDAPHTRHGLCLLHEPTADADGVTLCGHLHPTVRLTGRGRDRVRLPCFVVGPRHVILPAFSSFTGGGAWVPQPDERAFAIVGADIVPVPAH